jgi:phosphopantetheine--protein transferase-like protein
MNKVFGCGLDIEELSRFDKHLENGPFSLMEDICTRGELNNPCEDKKVRLALSFSCKEAFFKAFGVSWTNSTISWKDIELLFNGPRFDSYKVHLHNHAKNILIKNKACIGEISFDFNDEFVLFQVVLVKHDEE